MHPQSKYMQHQQVAPPQSAPSVKPPPLSMNYFAQYIEQSGLERRAHLNHFKGKKLGVDGAKILDNITQMMRESERLATLTSPIPYCAYDEMSRIYEVFQSNQISADYVFPGMGWTFPIRDKERTKTQDHNANILSLNGRTLSGPHEIHRLTRAADELQATLDEDAENYIFLYMKMFGGTPAATISVTRAPYWSWAQLSSYFNKRTKYVDAVYGCYELLAFKGIDTVITRIDHENCYYYVQKEDLLRKLNSEGRGSFTADDLPFLVGATSNHKLLNDPFIQNVSVGEFIARSQRDNQGQLSFNTQANPAHQVQQDRAARVADAIRLCPVLLPDGRCVPLGLAHGIQKVPKRRLIELFGEPLPSIHYYMQMCGLLSPSILSTVATKKIVDAAPVVDSPEYRSVAEFIIPLRTQIIYQLVQALQQPNRPPIEITWVRRYNREANSRELPILQPPQIRLDEWNTAAVNSTTNKVTYFTDVIPYAQSAVNSFTYRTTYQANAAVLLKILDLLGYFTHATQTNSTEVSGPSVYSTALEQCQIPSLSEYAVLLIELIRTKTLTEKHLFYGPKGAPSPPALSHVDPFIVFASRLLSIIPVRMKAAWKGPICADLCGFTGMARSVQRTLRSLAEVISVITFCENSRNPQHNQLSAVAYHTDVQPHLPFYTPLMSGSGVIIQYIMENRVRDIATLESVFPDCVSLSQDLSSLFYFWFYAGKMIKVLYEDEPQSMSQTYSMFAGACQILGDIPGQLLGPAYNFTTSL